MKRLCFNAIYKLLYTARVSKVHHKQLFDAIAGGFGFSYICDPSKYTNIAKGKEDCPPELIDKRTKANIDNISIYYGEHLIPLIESHYIRNIICAIQDYLSSDEDLIGNTEIGPGSDYTKDNIINNNCFDVAELLAHVIFFSCTYSSGAACKKELQEISISYLDSFKEKAAHIFPSSKRVERNLSLPMTSDVSRFKYAFKKVGSSSLSAFGVQKDVHFYKLDVFNYEFKYSQMTDYVSDNIGSYIYSRRKIHDLEVSGSAHNITRRAIKEFKRTHEGADAYDNDFLGDILLYHFLEADLGAPKLMSTCEMRRGYSASGAHIILSATPDLNYHQIVLGAATLDEDISVSIRRAFEKIEHIDKNRSFEIQNINSSIYSLGLENYDFLDKVLIPGESNDYRGPDLAFGVFLGYTLSIPHTGTTEEQRKYVDQKLTEDIGKIKPLILEEIKKRGMEGIAFYFYILPLNNALTDGKSILSDIFE